MRRLITETVVIAALALMAWGGTTLVDAIARLNRVEADASSLYKWLERVESKLDRVLEHK